MPVLNPRILSDLLAEVHTRVIVKRSVDHTVLETIAVSQSTSLTLSFSLCPNQLVIHRH